MRNAVIALSILACVVASARAQLSVTVAIPGISIGLNEPVYPQLVPVPGYPVYYAPQLNANYFFYDGMYWVYQRDNWYASSWYNGPWGLVAPLAVPLFILRVPVQFYRAPPPYFRVWTATQLRMGSTLGKCVDPKRPGWNHWNRNSAPPLAPLPEYQRQYADRYPGVEQQRILHGQNYRYQPRDAAVQRYLHVQPARAPAASPAQPRGQSSHQQKAESGLGGRPGDGNAARGPVKRAQGKRMRREPLRETSPNAGPTIPAPGTWQRGPSGLSRPTFESAASARRCAATPIRGSCAPCRSDSGGRQSGRTVVSARRRRRPTPKHSTVLLCDV